MSVCLLAQSPPRPAPPPAAVARPVVPTTEPAAAQSTDSPEQRLGALFSSRAAGIAFRPPAGGIQSVRKGYGQDIVQYSNPDEKWSLKVSRVTFDAPTKLLAPPPRLGQKTDPGILDEAARELIVQNLNADILRKDVVNIGPLDTGLLFSRFTQGGAYWLRQQAFIQAHNRLCFIFDFIVPSGHTTADKADDEDPAERVAMGIFRGILDSVDFLDQSEIIADNKARLDRLDAFRAGLPQRIKGAIVPDQYFRVLRQNRDVGWIYVAEELGEYMGKSGLIVATATFGQPNDNTTVNVSTEAFCSLDPRDSEEMWLTVTTSQAGAQRFSMSETGQSSKRTRRIVEDNKGADDKDPLQPSVREIEQRVMTVRQTGLAGPDSVERNLPPSYLPLGVAEMVPRLLPSKDAGYLFVTWVGAERELIYRYYDVQPEHQVVFNGQLVQARTVKERIGLEGDATFHYVSPDGKYLGSTNAATGITVVATDAQTIKRQWPDAKLLRPHLLEGKR
jgi:hypothetical protein